MPVRRPREGQPSFARSLTANVLVRSTAKPVARIWPAGSQTRKKHRHTTNLIFVKAAATTGSRTGKGFDRSVPELCHESELKGGDSSGFLQPARLLFLAAGVTSDCLLYLFALKSSRPSE